MSDLFSRRLALLAESDHLPLLHQCLHGIERECLRIDPQGHLAQTAHFPELGSALTHSSITTDYSEALLEFITGTAQDPTQVLQELEQVHRFADSVLAHQQEYLWSASMPCALPDEPNIPIAHYGTSNIGQLKEVYRRGLAVRYGKAMQCIAGIHYNFSLAPEVWPLLRQSTDAELSAQDFQSAGYIELIRNFHRYSWLLMYLFGASPALDRGFLGDRPHQLEVLDEHSLYLPYATSLRMSDLGYQSNTQAGLTPCYDDLNTYIKSLTQAVSTPYPPYADIGCQRDGEWIQINTNVLQIENEYYSSIRPKRVTQSGERPIHALRARGIQYVEVRCLDINPFLPLGIDTAQARFMTLFLIYCALQESPRLQREDCGNCNYNFQTVVREGRRPDLLLQRFGSAIPLQEWANSLLDEFQTIAQVLDKGQDLAVYQQALDSQRAKVADVNLTPSAQVLAQLRTQRISFTSFALQQSQHHAAFFREQPLSPELAAHFTQLAQESLAAQAQLEAQQSQSFDDFILAYQNNL